MPYFAKIDNSIVTEVIRIDQNLLNTGLWGDPNSFVETSYNTRGGIYYIPNSNPLKPDPDQSKALRANYAGIGYTYDSANDVFYDQRPLDMYGQLCNSWTIGAPTWLWNPPIPYPTDGKMYGWDEANQSWVEITP